MKRCLGVICVVGLAACGHSDGTKNAKDMAATSDMSMGTDMVAPNGTIGAAGGSVSLPDGTKVDIPAGALSTDTLITIAMTTIKPPGSVGPAYIFGPEGTQFAKPVTVTVPFTPSLLPANTTAADVVVMTSPAVNPIFTPLASMPSDSTHVSATTTHFSIFGAAVGMMSGGTDGGIDMVTTACTGNAVNGTFSGYSIATVVDSESQFKGGFLYISLADAEAGQLCGSANKPTKETQITISFPTNAPAPGTYAVDSNIKSGVSWLYYDNVGGFASGQATSGSIVITSVSASGIVGSFDVIMDGKDHVTACFSTAPTC